MTPPVMLFAFGPDDSFVFFCSTRVVGRGVSPAFSSTVIRRLGCPYSLTLGPGENEYAAIYLNKETGTMWRSINYPQNSHLYEIAKILFSKDGVSHPSDERISIGGPPDRNSNNRSYVVVKGGVAFYSSSKTSPSLPASLAAALDIAADSKKPIRDVVLGQGGAWFLQYANGNYGYDLAGRYTELLRILEAGVGDIQQLALSRYHPEHFFLVYGGNKKVRYSMSAGAESRILPLITEYYASCMTVSGAVQAVDGVDGVDGGSEAETGAGELPPPYETALDKPEHGP